jgi:3-dehydroquinate synthase
MQRLDVGLGERSYPILIGAGLLGRADVLDGAVGARDVLVVTNDVVAPLYLDRVRGALGGRRVEAVVLPDGERHKNLDAVSRVIDALVAARMNRDACVLALGGGVVGDVAGFAAASYQRGIDYVQAPTTLLAQVDSSVGGKTGVNHPGGKNLIGAFHQPRAVVADTAALATLPARELRAGYAEVLKYGLALDAAFLEWLEAEGAAVLSLDPSAVAGAVRRCCELKAAVVAEDEREHGRRALLNLGHTFGHAIEAAEGYGEWLHGEAVGVGLLMAADLSHRLGWLAAGDIARVRGCLERAGLPVEAPRIGAARALALMGMDKKVLGGRIRLVLLRRLGHAIVTGDYDDQALAATLAAGFGEAA